MEIAGECLREMPDTPTTVEVPPPSESHTSNAAVGANDITADMRGQKNPSNPPENVQNDTFSRSIEIQGWNNQRLDYYKLDSESENFQDYQKNNKTAPFEHVKVYKMSPWAYEQAKYSMSEADRGDQRSRERSRLHPSPGSIPQDYLRIYSPAIIHALRSVVTYYPSQNLSSDIIVIHRPYPVLVHHYDELANFRDQHARKDPTTLCSRVVNATKDLDCLLRFLDEQVMGELRKEIERNKSGLYTFKHQWLSHKPGMTLLYRSREDTAWIPGVIHSVSGGSFQSPVQEWRIVLWYMSSDGEYLTRRTMINSSSVFEGLSETKEDYLLFDREDMEQMMSKNPAVMEAVNIGKEYWKLLNKQCRFHMGRTKSFPHNEVTGIIMVDLKSYYDDITKTGDKSLQKPSKELGDTDLRSWTSDCDCAICITENEVLKTDSKFSADQYNNITTIDFEELTNHHYFLCPKEIHAFVFKTRSWELLHIHNMKEPNFDKDMINHLVMEPTLAETLKSLIMSYARVNIRGESLASGLWVADFVEGKGSGLIFLLHGTPGVGKTFTAECISNFLGRPLMVLTTSDIGIEPDQVEQNLAIKFKTAKSWNAVLLIDEADVYLAYRDVKDLKRSSLVASFLHALEYYDGILFLTTNRVGAFDDAVLSRVHVQLFYPEFTHEQRVQIWLSFIKRLNSDAKHSIRVNSTAKEYIRGKEVAGLSLNGREIKNAFQTAVALAEHEGIKDEDGKTLVTDDHIQAVLRLNKNFKNYIASIHEDTWAQRQWERPRE